MKKIILSLAIVAAAAAIVIGGSIAYFSDTETSVGNTFTAGTIDISVAGQNPWNSEYPMVLDKPCETNYINFTIRNVGENPANVWKRINDVQTDDGDTSYCGASSEPEYVEGSGTFGEDVCVNGVGPGANYIEQNNLAAYMIYDMYICHGVIGSVGSECPIIGDNLAIGAPDLTGSHGWIEIISEDNQVRIDNVNGVWIKLDDALAKDGALAVSQSYHLMAWDDAGVETITNWAQGDVMTFDIELEARQLTAPAPESEGSGLLALKQKDPATWEFIPSGANGTLAYNTSGSTFDYTLNASGLQSITDYCLIYYYDPYPGSGGFDIECGIATNDLGHITDHTGNKTIGSIPVSGDNNYPVGAKLWLVPDSDYDQGNDKMNAWVPANYLYEMNLIKYTQN